MYTLTCSPILYIRHTLGVLLVTAIWLMLSSSSAAAEEFCAVTLNVLDSGGAPISSTWIELVNSEGLVVRKEEMIGPTIRICDFGFGPHTLRVGTNECLPMAISNLRVVMGGPLHLKVTLNGCSYRDVMRNACLLYVRVKDNEGKPVPDADLSRAPPPRLQSKTDAYGRIQTLFRGSRDLVVTKEGFEPAVARAQCRSDEELDIEVIMQTKR